MEIKGITMEDRQIDEDDNQEEGPIDFGIEPTETLSAFRKPTAPRNLKKSRKCCCTIL